MKETFSGNSSEIFDISVDTSGAAAENTAWSFNNYDNKINALEANQALILRSSSFAEPEKTVL